jgi:hypothetical protein
LGDFTGRKVDETGSSPAPPPSLLTIKRAQKGLAVKLSLYYYDIASSSSSSMKA